MSYRTYMLFLRLLLIWIWIKDDSWRINFLFLSFFSKRSISFWTWLCDCVWDFCARICNHTLSWRSGVFPLLGHTDAATHDIMSRTCTHAPAHTAGECNTSRASSRWGVNLQRAKSDFTISLCQSFFFTLADKPGRSRNFIILFQLL